MERFAIDLYKADGTSDCGTYVTSVCDKETIGCKDSGEMFFSQQGTSSRLVLVLMHLRWNERNCRVTTGANLFGYLTRKNIGLKEYSVGRTLAFVWLVDAALLRRSNIKTPPPFDREVPVISLLFSAFLPHNTHRLLRN